MPLSAATVWEVRTTGNDSNGGGFVTGSGGTDFSQQNAAQAVLTAASTVGPAANQITVAGGDYTCIAGDVGNILQITGGTATVNFYHITARVGQVWTLDKNAGAIGATVVGRMGGALASLGQVGNAPLVTNNFVWIKSGTYTITSAATNVSGGCINTTVQIFIEGYNAARGDLGTRPLLQADGVITAFQMIQHSSNGWQWVRNIDFDGNNRATSRGITLRGHCYYCGFVNFTDSGIIDSVGTGATAVQCSATACSTNSPFEALTCIDCVAFNNTVSGFDGSGISVFFIRCVSYGNSGATSDGFRNSASAGKITCINCIAYNNGRDGFRLEGIRGTLGINCIAEDNAGWGFTHVGNNQVAFYNCGGFSNASGEIDIGTNVGSYSVDFVTGTGTFFTNAVGADFSLNNTAGGGADARAVGIPGVITGLATSTGYLDLGAFQHQDGGGGGGGEFSSVF